MQDSAHAHQSSTCSLRAHSAIIQESAPAVTKLPLTPETLNPKFAVVVAVTSPGVSQLRVLKYQTPQPANPRAWTPKPLKPYNPKPLKP